MTDHFQWGFKFRLGSMWIGYHYSAHNKRLCVNLIPCVTIWFVGAGGYLPR